MRSNLRIVLKEGYKDKIIIALVSFMIMSFYLFEQQWWGRYVLFAVTVIVTVISASEDSWRIRFRFGAFHLHMLLLAAYCFASSLWAWVPSLAVSKGITILLILICFSALYTYYQSKNSVDYLLKSIMYAGYGVAIYSFVFYGFSGIQNMMLNGIRIENEFANANSLGMIAAFSCIIQTFYWIKDRITLSSVFIIPAVLLILISQSRKAIVLLILGEILVSMVISKDNRALRRVANFFLILIILFFLIFILSKLDVFSSTLKRFVQYFDSVAGNREENIRDVFRQIGFNQFFKKPIFGIGIGNSSELLGRFGQRRTYLHDNFAELLACGGIVGFAIYYSMYVRVFFVMWKNKNTYKLTTYLCLILLVLLVVMDYGRVSYASKQQYVFFMLFFLQSEFLLKSKPKKRLSPRKAVRYGAI